MLFVCYPKCTTCQKARAFLEERAIPYEFRDIKLDNPKKEELREWQHRSGLPLKRFFNTSGLQYKALGLKDRLPGMDEEEQLDLLAADGMLVKRPILAGEDFVLVGFKPAEWEARFGKSGGTQKSRLNCKKPEKSFYPRAARPSAKTSSADRKPRISRG